MKFLKSHAIPLLLCCLTLLSAGCSAKAKIERHVQRGDEYFQKEEWEKARLEYLNAFRKGARDPELMTRLGECFLKGGDANTAIQFFAEVRKVQPTNITVRTKLAALLAARGYIKNAREEAEGILKVSEDDPEALILLTDSVSSKEEIDKIRPRLEQIYANSPTNANIIFALGILEYKVRNLEKSRELLQKAISIDPKQSRFHVALADVSFMLRDAAAADASFKNAVALSPVKSWERLRYAEYLLRTQRDDDAEELLVETVTKEPKFPKALNMLTEALLSKSKLDEAAKYNAQLLAEFPTDHDAQLSRARIKIARREIDAAITDLDALSKTFPRDAAVQHMLAIAHLAKSDVMKALSALDTAVGLNPKHVQAVLLRSEIQLQQGNADAAIPELTRITREFPQVVQANYLLAVGHRQKGELDKALEIYAHLAKALPRDPRPQYFSGVCYRQQNKTAEARAAYESALKINPGFISALEDLLALDIADQKPHNAMARLLPYLDKYPNKAAPLLLKARILTAERKHQEAIATLQKAVEVEPSYYAAHGALAELYIGTGKLEEALAKLNWMVSTNSKDANAWLQLAGLHELKKDFKSAREAYENVLKRSPENARALNNLANILSEHFQEKDASLEYIRKARDLAPKDPAVADTYGWILWKNGDYVRALPPLQESAEKLPASGEVRYHLGMTHYMLGDEQAARTALEFAVASRDNYIGKDRAAVALNVLKIDPSKADPSATQLIQKAASDNPNDFVALLRAAEIHDHAKQWDKAVSGYEAALKANPASVKALARLAEINCFNLGKPQQGLEFAKQAWTASKEPALAAILGPVGHLAGDFKWAALVLAEARRSRPDDARTAFYSGLNSYALGNLPQAREAFEVSATSPNPLPLAKVSQPLVAFQMNPSTGAVEAAAAATDALKLDPNYPPALVANGIAAEQKKDFNNARSLYEQVLKSFAGHVTAQRQLGLLLAENLAADQQASQILGEVKNSLPGDPQVTKALGKLAYRRSDYREAVRLLRDSSMKLANDSDLLYHLGLSQFHINERAAKDSLNRALKLDTNSVLAADAKKALAELK